jgi:hypothetical protein
MAGEPVKFPDRHIYADLKTIEDLFERYEGAVRILNQCLKQLGAIEES